MSGLVYVDPTHWPLLPLFFNTLFLAPLVFLSFYTATVLYSYCRAILPPLLCFSPNHFTVRLGEGFTSLRLQYLPRTLLRLLLHIPSFLGVKRGFLCWWILEPRLIPGQDPEHLLLIPCKVPGPEVPILWSPKWGSLLSPFASCFLFLKIPGVWCVSQSSDKSAVFVCFVFDRSCAEEILSSLVPPILTSPQSGIPHS